MAKYRKPGKLIAIFFLTIFLLNIAGDIAVHQYLVFRSDRLFDYQISRGLYNKNDLTEVKIPADMPGMSDWKSFEKLSGEVRFANVAYNYVAIKMTHNAIYLQCVPNYKTTRLFGCNIIHAENMPDIPVSPKQHVPFNKISVLSHFNLEISCFAFTINSENIPLLIKHPTDRQISRYAEIPEQPPRHC